MKYTVEVKEILRKVVIVKANSEEEAIQKVQDEIKEEKLVLTADDYNYREVKLLGQVANISDDLVQ